MKKTFILLALIGFGASVQAQQNNTLRPCVTYRQGPRAEWQGDSLRVGFSGEISRRLKGPEALYLVPVYIMGKDTVRYPELGFFTPSGAKYHRRRETFSDRKTEMIERVVSRRSPGNVDYSQSRMIPHSARGELRLFQILRTCCSERLLASETVAVPERAVVVPDTVYTPVEMPAGMLPLPVAAVSVPLFETNVTFIRPKAETVKERTATATIRITYPVNRWEILPDLGKNAGELSRIERIFAPMTSDTGTYAVQDVRITGYASPEGTYDHNMMLSENRARSMRDYLRERYGFPAGKVVAQGGGEDWKGLYSAVEKSDMPERDEILAIIDGYDVFDGREKALMELRGGAPYKHMLHTLFPSLRRMEMEMAYRVRAFGPDEAGDLIDSRPQDLSLQEMYEVARAGNDNQTIIRQRNEYGREYDIAVRYYPDDAIANINASSAALVRGDLELAWLCLGKVKDNPLAANNLGVYHWLCGKIEEAKAYFRKAAETDPERAAYNLEQLQKWEEEFGNKNREPNEP